MEADNILITHEDRLARFGLKYLEKLFQSHDKNLIVKYDDTEAQSPEQELVEDMIKLVSSFSGRLYRMRSKKRKQVIDSVKQVVWDD